jgi:hypothetical protein
MAKLIFNNIDEPGEQVSFQIYHRHDETCDIIVGKLKQDHPPTLAEIHAESNGVEDIKVIVEKRIFARISAGDARILSEALRRR